MEALASMESTLEYHPCLTRILTRTREAGPGTVSGGQFDWGGLLLKGNGGVQRWAWHGWQSCGMGNAISLLNCETDGSSRWETRT